jgi:hypothetical protein
MKCTNCGEEIIMFSGAGPWVHAEGFSIECECPLYAEAEPHPEESPDYVSFEHEPNWSILEGK